MTTRRAGLGRNQPLPQENRPRKKVVAVFFRTETGNEPVRTYLKGIVPKDDRRRINTDIRTVEYGWPVGMPTSRPLGDGLHEVRTNLKNRISRVLFYIDEQERMVLLHGFIKKTEETPDGDKKTARDRKSDHEKTSRARGQKNE